VTEDKRDAGERSSSTGNGQRARKTWTRPVVTAYGPIGKLTQGGTGLKDDGGASKKK
jgi:hypothetical protein